MNDVPQLPRHLGLEDVKGLIRMQLTIALEVNLRLPQLYLNSTFFNSVSIPSTNYALYTKDRGFPDGSV